MAIVKMSKITLIDLEEHKDRILETLMDLGVVDVDSVEPLDGDGEGEEALLESYEGCEEEVVRLNERLSGIKSAIDYVGKYEGGKKGLFSPKRIVDRKKFDAVIENRPEIWNVIEQILGYTDRLSSLQTEENTLRNHIAALEPWKQLSVPLDSQETKNVILLTGTIPAFIDEKGLIKALEEAIPESYLEIVNKDKDQSYLFAACHKAREEEFLASLKEKGFSRTAFKDLKGIVKDNIKAAEDRISSINSERDEIKSAISAFCKEKESLEILHDYYAMKRDRKGAVCKLAKTGKTFILKGWLPSGENDRVQKELLKQYDCFLEITEPEKDEEHPILLKNNSFIEPFEIVTELYSLPSSKGIDPNLFMAPFFFAFFGLMVGDAGYGILIALAAGIVLKKFQLKGMAHKIIKLLFFGGISTFIWGALFGGWFGDLVTAVTGGKYTIPYIWFNPMEKPMQLLIWSFIFGAIHIFVGMGLKGYMLIRDGKLFDAIFDVGSWFVLLPGVAILFAGGTIGAIGKYMAIVGALMLILTQGRDNKNILKRLMSGVLSLYNITGFLSDVLSYSRLLALGLATGVIASVINTMGTLFGMNPFGILVLLIVLVIGTVFNVLINVLGAFVHASRLQYVEFFGKFYESGGKGYKPLSINTKFIDLIDRRES